MLTESQSPFFNSFLKDQKRNLNESMFHPKQQQQMITENISQNIRPRADPKTSRPLRIVKETKDGLIVSNGSNEMVFKRFAMDDDSMAQHLQKRYLLRHESLIKIHNIEYDKVKKQEGENSDQLYCGILFEKYIKTMEQSIKEMLHFTHEEVIQTFTPIKEVIDYMVYQDYDPGQLTYASVVCNENYQIKFVDSFFAGQGLRLKEREVNIYEELAQLTFGLLFPEVKKEKPWKYKYQIAERELNAEGFHFFQDIYKKFITITTKSIKSKPIKKEIKTKAKAKNKSIKLARKDDTSSPQKKNLHSTLINCQAGKQNQIIQ